MSDQITLTFDGTDDAMDIVVDDFSLTRSSNKYYGNSAFDDFFIDSIIVNGHAIIEKDDKLMCRNCEHSHQFLTGKYKPELIRRSKLAGYANFSDRSCE